MNTVVLLAAGMSTRYGRLKQLEPVGPAGEALLDFAVFDAHRAGFSRVVLIIREELEGAFRTHLRGRWPHDLEVVFHHQELHDLPGLSSDMISSPTLARALRERRKPWGTAHALLTARGSLEEPFVILNADDFYGEMAFRLAAGFRVGEAVPFPTLGLVTYTLKDTLSPHGGVSRGVCEVDEEGWLLGIREILDIRKGRGELTGRTVNGDPVTLTGTEPISTNFWIFSPVAFPLLEREFERFMEEEVGPTEGEPEFLIPTVMDSAIQREVVRVRAMPTTSRFLGITHPEDRASVVEGLKELTREGHYTAPLWG